MHREVLVDLTQAVQAVDNFAGYISSANRFLMKSIRRALAFLAMIVATGSADLLASDFEIWAKELADGNKAVSRLIQSVRTRSGAHLQCSRAGLDCNVPTMDAFDLNLVTIRDLWRQKDIGILTDSY